MTRTRVGGARLRQFWATARRRVGRPEPSAPFERRVLDAASLRRAPPPGAPTLRVAVLAYRGATAAEIVASIDGVGQVVGVDPSIVGPEVGKVVAVEPVYTVVVDTGVRQARPVDVAVLPGGIGWRPLGDDAEVVTWVRRTASASRAVLAISTGSLIAAAAGLLTGQRATGHWLASRDLEQLGAVADSSRVVEGPHIVTATGASAAREAGRRIAERVRWGPGGSEPAPT